MAYDVNRSIALEPTRSLTEIVKELNERLGPELRNLGTFAAHHWPSDSTQAMPPEWSWIACFAVRGGSEGYYVHVECINCQTNSRQILALTKVWSWADAFQLCNAATLILHGEPKTQQPDTNSATRPKTTRTAILKWGSRTTPFQRRNEEPILYHAKQRSIEERLWHHAGHQLGLFGWLSIANNCSEAVDHVSILDLPDRDWREEYHARVSPEEAADIALDEYASVHGLPVTLCNLENTGT